MLPSIQEIFTDDMSNFALNIRTWIFPQICDRNDDVKGLDEAFRRLMPREAGRRQLSWLPQRPLQQTNSRLTSCVFVRSRTVFTKMTRSATVPAAEITPVRICWILRTLACVRHHTHNSIALIMTSLIPFIGHGPVMAVRTLFLSGLRQAPPPFLHPRSSC